MISVARDKCDNRRMAEWDNIINNCLSMGRGRWLTYAANAEKRWREEEERKPRARPLQVGGGAQISKIYTMGEAEGREFPKDHAEEEE